MRYLFQRIVHNENQWMRPSQGRRGSGIDGGYLDETGFAHEDWNFRKDIWSDGYVHGYIYFKPKNTSGPFNILFAIYNKGEGWALAGFYEHATYGSDKTQIPAAVLHRRVLELKELDEIGGLGGDYAGATSSKIDKLLRREAEDYRWLVRPEHVHPMQTSLRLPTRLANFGGKHFTRPTELAKTQYDAITAFAGRFADRPPLEDYSDGGSTEFPEGRVYQSKHFKRERSPQLVAQAKAQFKQRHGRLFCEACKFDFRKVYGVVGHDFVEVHHLKPLSEMKPGDKTKLDDLALVCSNCHRILHRRRPWMTIDALKKLLKNPF